MNALSFAALHQLLTSDFGLLPEPEHSGSWRTYFWQVIDWHPASSTRVVKVIVGQHDMPLKILRCVSSDNNNSVFVDAPFEVDALALVIEDELRLLLQMQASHAV